MWIAGVLVLCLTNIPWVHSAAGSWGYVSGVNGIISSIQSLNTFIADDYNTAAATEVPDKKYKPEEAITNLALNTRNRNSTILHKKLSNQNMQ